MPPTASIRRTPPGISRKTHWSAEGQETSSHLRSGDHVSFVNRPTPLKRSIEFRLKTKTLLFPVSFPNTA
jgi:hypothetical protein